MDVYKRLLGQLEAMGFSKAQSEKAISSGNSTIEAAVNWLADHEDDTNTTAYETEMPLAEVNVNIGGSNSFHVSEQVKFKAHELRNQRRKKLAEQGNKLEKEREKERIRAGKELLEAKRILEESEWKRHLAQRKAEKEEERRARERIRQKLQQDKLERRGVHGLPTKEPVSMKTDAVLPQSTESLQSVNPANIYAVRDQMRECLRSIKLQNKDDDSKATQAFQTLLVYVRNIIKDVDEGKFRKIRLSNPVFQDRIGRYKKGIEFLELCGFERAEGSNFLLLPEEKLEMSTLKLAWTELYNALTNPFFGLFSA